MCVCVYGWRETREREREEEEEEEEEHNEKVFKVIVYKITLDKCLWGDNLVTFIRFRFKIKNQNVPKCQLFFLVMENLMSPAFTLLHYL